MSFNWKQITKGGVVGVVGFLLSPLSWWNDLFVNIPIAYGVGIVANKLFHVSLLPVVIGAYWVTNIVGLIMLHRGVATMAGREAEFDPSHRKRLLIKNFIISIIYTIIIVVLIQRGIFHLPDNLLGI